MMRNEFEKIEEMTLAPCAAKSKDTKGRRFKTEPCELRTEYQRDRDRILHCRSFRMLKHKTQVFLAPEGDFFRTRLTHTLEVSQIARTISRALRLNEDLTEAIALGHDLGHTPFGHAGERALSKCIDGFKHNEQSLRIVDELENGTGLNLTWEVRDGILNHKKNMYTETLEGMVVNFSDRIAYLNHDIDDAVYLGALDESRIPAHITKSIGKKHGERIDSMIKDIVFNSIDQKTVSPSDEMIKTMDELRDFMFEEVYFSENAKKAEGRIDTIINLLFEHYINEPDDIKEEQIEKWGIVRAVVDYISGMSDRYAIERFESIFMPKIWI